MAEAKAMSSYYPIRVERQPDDADLSEEAAKEEDALIEIRKQQEREYRGEVDEQEEGNRNFWTNVIRISIVWSVANFVITML